MQYVQLLNGSWAFSNQFPRLSSELHFLGIWNASPNRSMCLPKKYVTQSVSTQTQSLSLVCAFPLLSRFARLSNQLSSRIYVKEPGTLFVLLYLRLQAKYKSNQTHKLGVSSSTNYYLTIHWFQATMNLIIYFHSGMIIHLFLQFNN